ncbi:hypothetical protein [Halococcoides cellulosivorans]|uniref:Uncharacterized protein n=1 Tax=Halococcoides cellulosivorans TaxID=1679096 RepID=A0A2R4X3W5_9EURY|nr:hypothetical protein [Halococcoides cellulosivorans]AWB28479.1 hypothetical protein HARCEL1_12590 [Halococcoides cellulosivorans]
MSTATEASQVFDWLDEERLANVAAKLRRLPTGSEFERRVEEALSSTVDIEGRTYEEILDDHGDLVGYADPDEERLPWWLDGFKWTVTAEPLDTLTIDDRSLDQFEEYPLDSTSVEDITLNSAASVVEGLEAFATLEETLTNAVSDPTEHDREADLSEFELPQKLFVVPEEGRIATSESFETWFERMINLCPPGCPELTALFRVNANVERRHADRVLDGDELERLTELGVFDSSEPEARAFNEDYHESLSTLLQIRPPFDLEFDLEHDKGDLTKLQYAYYRAWARDTNRFSNEQKWLRKAQNRDDIGEGEEYRFTEYAFRLPTRISRSNVVFEDQSNYGNSSESEAIGELIEEFGHPVNDD